MQSLIHSLPFWLQVTLLCVPSLVALFAAIGLILNVSQSRRTNAQARSALVAECLRDFNQDDEMRNAFYAIEYSTFQYDEGFADSKRERELDKLLGHFANVALAWKCGLLGVKDTMPLQYFVLRIMRDEQVGHYLKFVADWSAKQGIKNHPFTVLEELSEKIERKCRMKSQSSQVQQKRTVRSPEIQESWV